MKVLSVARASLCAKTVTVCATARCTRATASPGDAAHVGTQVLKDPGRLRDMWAKMQQVATGIAQRLQTMHA